MEKSALSGKVAKILNVRELVINIGEKQGVELGMVFKVLAETPINILDPDSDEELGVIDREKIRVKVIELSDNFSVCKTFIEHVIPGILDISARSFSTIRKPETLKIDNISKLPPLSEEESYIKVGDRVQQTTEL